MANRTVKDAKSIKGTNPQYLIEKIIRSRIYDCKYWKEECFALTAELLVDKAMELKYIGGIFGGNVKPTPFLCLILKMLQIQPEKDIIVEFIKNDEFKYVRALGAYYMRLTGTSLDCYNYLEPLLNDFRKLRRQDRNGGFEVIYMDDFIDDLLREERACDIILPRIQKRHVLEEANEIQPRISILENDDDDDDLDDDIQEEAEKSTKDSSKSNTKHSSKSKEKSRRRSDSSSPERGRRDDRRSRERDRDRHRKNDRPRERSRDREREHRHRGSSRDRDPRGRHRDRDYEADYYDYDRGHRDRNRHRHHY